MTHPFEAFKFCPVCGSDKFYIHSPLSKKCEECGFVYFKNPAIGAVPVILDNKNRLVVVRRAKKPDAGTLHLSGGFVDIGETIEEAMVREVKEETNIDIEVGDYLFSYPNNYKFSVVDAYPLDFFFRCRIKNMDNIKLQEKEVSEILFLKKEEINVDDFGFKSIKKGIARLLEMDIWDNKKNHLS